MNAVIFNYLKIITNTMNILDLSRLAGMFLIPLIVVLIPIYIGQRYGIYRKKKSENLQNASVGSVVAAAFGLLAFMLAFTFQIAAGRYEARKELLLEEVTAPIPENFFWNMLIFVLTCPTILQSSVQLCPVPNRSSTSSGNQLKYWQSGTGVQKCTHSSLHQ
jgi:hypothetical protein